MTKQYYYTVNTLPYLVFDETPPIHRERFFEICNFELQKSHIKQLASIHLYQLKGDCDSSDVINKWLFWERSVRNALVILRASKLKIDATTYQRANGYTPYHLFLAKKIFSAENPFIAEKIFDKSRWHFFEELEKEHLYSIEKLILYYLKLQILDRRALFDTKMGKDKFSELVNMESLK